MCNVGYLMCNVAYVMCNVAYVMSNVAYLMCNVGYLTCNVAYQMCNSNRKKNVESSTRDQFIIYQIEKQINEEIYRQIDR